MLFLSFVKLYFSSTFNYVQFSHIKLDIKVPVLPSVPHVRLPNRQCHAFLQERIQNAVKRSKKSHVRSSEGAPPKMCVHSFSKKVADESKKDKLLISEKPEIKRVSYLCFHSEHTDATLIVTLCAQLKDITLTTQSFIFVLFICRHYNKYYVMSLQIKSSLVLIINYSKDLAFK